MSTNDTQPATKGDITVLKGDITVLKGDVNILKSDVNILKSDVNILKSDVAAIKDDVAGLKGGLVVVRKDMKQLGKTIIHQMTVLHENLRHDLFGAMDTRFEQHEDRIVRLERYTGLPPR